MRFIRVVLVLLLVTAVSQSYAGGSGISHIDEDIILGQGDLIGTMVANSSEVGAVALQD